MKNRFMTTGPVSDEDSYQPENMPRPIIQSSSCLFNLF